MKFLRLILFIILPAVINAQQAASTKPDPAPLKELVRAYMTENKTNWKLTDSDIINWTISDLYSNDKTGTTYLYVHQQVNGIRIFNAVSSISIKDGMIKSFAKRLYPDAASKINTNHPSNSATFAIRKTAEHLGLIMKDEPKLILTNKSAHRTYYSLPGLSNDKIRVELVLQPVKKTLRLAWDVSLHLINGSHWWNVRIDAVNGEVLQKNDWTTHCDFGTPEPASFISPPKAPANNLNRSSSIPSYRVFRLPLEAPTFGNSTLIPNPSDGVASPFGWHDTNGSAGAEYNITRGNNVYAYDDTANTNTPGYSPNGTASLTFDFPANLTQQPLTYLAASITNLFYINNMMHDRLYHYGFDEAAGNFQENNYGNGGAGHDYVLAECQDGGGNNNANFSTPDDGQNGRMQMYLWSPTVPSLIVINSPPSIAGNYDGVPAGFGPAITTPITSDLVLVDDGTGTTTDACEPLINGPALSGKIAVIDRGTCTFVSKILLAQNAGAIAVIVVNNVSGVISMGGNGGSVTIPSEMISKADGDTIKGKLINGDIVNVTLNPPPPSAIDNDGSFDNGVVMHEYGHGVSTRLTGGPLNSNCLNNGEEGGEGWSDFFALMFTMRPGDSGTAARGIGSFASGQPANGHGIRRYSYSTDMNIDPETYSLLSQSSEVHNIGEVWCTALWEMNWGLIDQYGFNADWINGTSGNNIALRLVMEGLKLQPCGPGFLDSRDAILQADDNLYNGIHKCLIWKAFAKRGMGFHADQGDADVAGDETEDFSLAPICITPTAPPSANFIADITNTCFGIIHFTDSSTNLAQSWRWNFGDGDTSILENPTHTYSSVGTYNVTLIVTNTLGVDTLIRTGYITFSKPSATLIIGDTIVCSGSSTTLTSNFSSGNEVEWSDADNSILFTGSVFNTPNIFSPTTYYVEQYTPTNIQNVGPLDSALGAGGFSNSQFEGRLLFTTMAPMRLKSVWVYAFNDTIRTIKLYGPGNTLIKSLSVIIPRGLSRVDLNFDLPANGNYQIGVSTRSRLYRNTAGANFPYSVNGLVNITGSNSPQNSVTYFYLYNWEVQVLPCSSTPVPVNISINPDPASSFNSFATGLNVQFTNTSTGNLVSYLWNFGNGDTSVQQNPSVTYSNSGSYTVSLTVTSSNGCQSVSAKIISVSVVGINEFALELFNIYYSDNELVIKFQSAPLNARIRIYDPIGKLLLSSNFKNGIIFTTQLQNISPEFILVNVQENDQNISRKIILSH